MSKWIELKMPYGKRHIHKTLDLVTIEQFSDGRDWPFELWVAGTYKNLDPAGFKDLRSARKYVKENIQ